MRNALFLALAVVGVGLGFACGGSKTCTDFLHTACDLDGGQGCPAHQACLTSHEAVDPCAGDAGSCCFQVCAADSDCPSGQYCIAGSCAQGRCVQ